MIALGSTIGTGLFLTSAISVKLRAGVILSFALGALITLAVMWALAEMAVEHPAAGSLVCMRRCTWAVGGFAARYTYWLCLVIVIGSEVGGHGNLLQILVSKYSVVALDRGIFRCARLREHAEHRQFWND